LPWIIFNPANDDPTTLPDDTGIYVISFEDPKKLPSRMQHLSYVSFVPLGDPSRYPVMYIGKSGTAGIRKRYRNHFLGTARNSTLRKSLGVLCEYQRHYYNNGKYRFVDKDENRLSECMKRNLLFIYRIVDDFDDVDGLETSLIEQYHPPLNLENNTSEINHEFRENLTQLRNVFRDRDTAETLIAYCRENGRVCPQPILWHELFQMLPNARRTPYGWNLNVPLILGAWGEDDRLKQERLAEHIRWAEENNFIDEISRFLRCLREEDWFHGWGNMFYG
jgi:hypothetical protein